MIIVKTNNHVSTAAFISVNTAKYEIKILKSKDVFVLTNNKIKSDVYEENDVIKILMQRLER